jgi:uroporphyrinogen-III synthase
MLPLEGKRILITRALAQASELARQLEALGAMVISIPSIELAPPESYVILDNALRRLDTFDLLVFTSVNAVGVFSQRRVAGLLPKRIAVIGPATAKAVENVGLTVDLIPQRFIAESLVEAMVPQVQKGSRVLLVRAEEARDILPEALIAAGAYLTIAPAYRNQLPSASIPAIREAFSSPARYPEAVMLTSASTVRNLFDLIDAAGVALPEGIAFASIGPVTSNALREQGLEPDVEASEATLSALVHAVADLFRRS